MNVYNFIWWRTLCFPLRLFISSNECFHIKKKENIRVLRMTNTFKMLDGISNKQQRKQHFANKTTDRVPNMCNVVCFALSLLIFIQIHRNYIKNLTVNYTNFFVIKRIYKCGNTLWKLKYRFIPLDIFAIFFLH